MIPRLALRIEFQIRICSKHASRFSLLPSVFNHGSAKASRAEYLEGNFREQLFSGWGFVIFLCKSENYTKFGILEPSRNVWFNEALNKHFCLIGYVVSGMRPQECSNHNALCDFFFGCAAERREPTHPKESESEMK